MMIRKRIIRIRQTDKTSHYEDEYRVLNFIESKPLEVIQMKKSMLILAALALTLLAFSLNREIPTSAQEEVDISVLIETADTPEDHLKIAEFYE